MVEMALPQDAPSNLTMHFRPNVMEGKYQICFNFMDSVLRKQSNVLNEINYFKLEMGLKHSF